MFEEFDANSKRGGRRRLGLSLVGSALIYGVGFGTVVLATASVRNVTDSENLVQIELRNPVIEPPPPPPPEPVEAARPSRPSARAALPRAQAPRPRLEAPDKIPDQKPAESNEPLVAAPSGGEQGSTDGPATAAASAGGAGQNQGPSPLPPARGIPMKPSAPIRDANTLFPEYPRSARRAGIQATVVARIFVAPSGMVSRVEIIDGPDVFHASVRAALLTWRYTPARLPDGTAVADSHIVRIPFKLD